MSQVNECLLRIGDVVFTEGDLHYLTQTTTDIALNLEQLKQVSGGATNHDFCVDPLVLIWKLNNPGKDLPKWLGGTKDPSSKF